MVGTATITVLIAEDKDVIRVGLRQMVASMGDCEVVGVATDGDEVLRQVATLKPKVVLLKDNLPGTDGVAVCSRIKDEHPGVGTVLMLSEASDFFAALAGKADAYFFREVPESILEPTIRTVARGGAYIGSFLAEYLLRGEGYNMLRTLSSRRVSNAAMDSLSNREKQVLGLLSQGHSNEEIAKHLGLSIQTVKVHVKHILKKLGVSDRTQAVIKALKSGY